MAFIKLAATCAVFIDENNLHSSAQERDGLTGSAAQLHVNEIPEHLSRKKPMQNSLSLEGLVDYDPPSPDDAKIYSPRGSRTKKAGSCSGRCSELLEFTLV